MELSGGTISNNTTNYTANNEKFKGIYVENSFSLKLSNNSTITVDRLYLPSGKTLTVSEAPAAGSEIHVMLETIPSMGNPVVIAQSETNCSSSFVVDNNNLPDNTELVWKNNQIILRCFSTVITSWEELQDALDRGGNLQSDNTYMLQLTQDLTAESSDNTLVFAYTQHPVILDLNGHTIDRNLTAATENGNVLTVSSGTLTIRDSSTEKTGKIKDGYNDGEGGGVRVLGGTLTMEGGSITSNYATSGGGGVYVYGGSFIMEGGSVKDNMAKTYGSGIYVIEGSANIKGSVISGNRYGDTNLHGGGIFVGGEGSLTIEDSEIKDHQALYGGGVYVAAGGSATMTSGSISGNTATSDGGGIYVAPDGSATINGGSIQSNTAMNNGGGILIESGSLDLKGGTISGNTAIQNGKGIYQDGSLTLSEGAELNVTDSVYLPADKFITVNRIPTEPVHVQLESIATLTNPVVIAHSETDCRDIFVIDSKQPNTELFYDGADHAVKLRLTPVVTTWAELQAALNSGGVQVEDEYWIELGADIVATSENSRLVMENIAHPVILDLNGHTINRALTQAAENGNVLTVNGGDLTIRDSSTNKTGRITGGYNSGMGGGVCVAGGRLIMEGGSITGNHSTSNGGGVYVTGNDGYFTIESGSITGNTSAAKGGGIYDEGGNLYLKGGSITGNTSTDLGGGIYMSNARLQSSGSPVVTDNGSSNVYLTEPMDNNGLTAGANIGVGANLVGRFAGNIPYSEGIEIFTADTGFRLYEDGGDCLSIEPEGHEAESEPRWVWSDDLTTATATMHCKNCGQVIWTASNIEVTFEYDTTGEKLYANASVEHDSENYEGRLELHPLHVEEQQPRIDENKVYHSGTKAHYKLNVVNATYYFTEVDGHPGAKCTEESLRLDMFKFVQQGANRGIAAYTGGFDAEGTYILLPGAIENPENPNDPLTALELSFLGDGENPFYTLPQEMQAAPPEVEIMDYGTITHISANAFADIQNLTLKLRAYNKSITIADSAFVNGADVKIIAYSTSKLGKGEHQQGTGESAGKYTVAFVDEPSDTVTADWAEDYSSAQITITDETGEITHTFPATNITRTETETEDPETHVKTYTLSIKAEGIYEGDGQTYSVELNDIPFFNVTVQGTEGTLRMPKVRNADNTGYTDYAVFTVKQDMLAPLNPPAGAVLAGLYDGMRIYGVGTRVEIRQDTNFTAGWRSVWARVQDALSEGKEITLYSDISPAQGDIYLHVPQGVTATLNLNGHTVNRGLNTAAANGYVIRVDGSLTLNNGTVTGGNNRGDGGGIYLFDGGSLITNNVTVSSNHAQNGGGVYMVDFSQAEFNNSTIIYNVANQYGGGLYVGGERPSSNSGLLGDPSGSTNAKLLNVSIVNNRAQNAGGLFVNSGEVQLGSNTKIINNTDLDGHKFNNIDVVGGIMNLISGAKGLLLGLPIAGSVSSLKGWALGLLGALAAGGILAAVVCDRDKTSSDDDQEKECESHIWRCELKWANDYSSVKEYVRCSECGKILEINDLPVSVSIDEDMYTHYKVEPKYKTTDDTDQKVPPYKLVKQANIPEVIDTTDTAVDFIDDVKLIPHGKGQPWEEVLGSSKWKFVENSDKLEFDDWLWNNSKVTKVNFTGPDDQTITVQVHWLLPYGYAPHDSTEDPAKGSHPLTPEPNPKYVEIGTQETVKENQWKRLFYKFNTWRVPVYVKIVKEGTLYKLVYTYSEVDIKEIEDKKKPGDQLKITGPVILRAEWQSKWKDLGDTLKKERIFTMTEPVTATLTDDTIKIEGNSESVLALNGMMLNGAAAPKVQSVLNVVGILAITDLVPTSGTIGGMITGGHTTANGGGITVGSDGTLTLQGGNIVSNEAQMLNDKTGNGGGVSVSGNFIMSGGSVRNNTAGNNGGGVYIANNAVFSMSGGEISGNRAGINDQNAKGGGVYVGGSFSVSGTVIIKDNTVGVNASNVYLPTGKTITVSGKLDNASEIHVSMQTPGVITRGLNANGGEAARGKAENFVSDDDDYMVVINNDGEAELVIGPVFDQADLELGGILRLRFKMAYPNGWEHTNNERMEFYINGREEPLTISYQDAPTDEDDKKYFACPVNAYQMADTIQAYYYYSNAHTGVEEFVHEDYSVKEYLDYLLEHASELDGKTLALVQATKNYGHYIQPYLAVTNHWTVDVDYAEMDAYGPVTPAENPKEKYGDYKVSFHKEPAYSALVSKSQFYLTLDSDTILNVRVYLRNKNDPVEGTANWQPVTPWERTGNSWVLSLRNLPATALEQQYSFTCSVNGQQVFTMEAAPLSFVNYALADGGSSEAEELALTALYEYAMAANAYAAGS